MRIRLCAVAMLLVGLVAVQAKSAVAANPTKAGEFVVDPPTLINLGFEWFIDGDDNRNARGRGHAIASRARPRWQHGAAAAAAAGRADLQRRSSSTSIAPNMFAGSILDLEPDTAYEARFVLTDPDGVAGEAQKTVTVRTRPEPKPAAGGRVVSRLPAGIQGHRRSSRRSKG